MRGKESSSSRRERERREHERERGERERERGGEHERERGGERERERGGERERERGGEREKERERDKESEIAKPAGTKYLNIPLILNIPKEQFNNYKVCNKSIYKCLCLCNLCIFILRFNFLFYIF
jgi:hypothetical protein